MQGLDAKAALRKLSRSLLTDKHWETTTVDVTVNVKGTDDTPELTLGKVLSAKATLTPLVTPPWASTRISRIRGT